MINKKMYAFLVIALLSFTSLNMVASMDFIDNASENAIEYVEQEIHIESEVTDFSFSIAHIDLIYKDRINILQINHKPLRPPIFS